MYFYMEPPLPSHSGQSTCLNNIQIKERAGETAGIYELDWLDLDSVPFIPYIYSLYAYGQAEDHTLARHITIVLSALGIFAHGGITETCGGKPVQSLSSLLVCNREGPVSCFLLHFNNLHR